MRIKVENNESFVRDLNSGAIININSTQAEIVRKKKAARLQQQQEMSELKGEVAEIKELLNKLIEKL
jgi:hypothetical protein